MSKGIKKIKCIKNGWTLQRFQLKDRLVIAPDRDVLFEIEEWGKGTTDDDKKKLITWMLQNQDRKTIIHQEKKHSTEKFALKLPKRLCGNYNFYIEASLSGKQDFNNNTGLYIRGICPYKVVGSKWAKTLEGNSIKNRNNEKFICYGDDVFLQIETEGLNGNTIIVEIWNQQFLRKDKLIQIYKNVRVVDGFINLEIRNTYAWRAIVNRIQDIENFYVKIKTSTDQQYIKDSNGDESHAIYLNIKNKITSTKTNVPQNRTATKIYIPKKNKTRYEPCKFDVIKITEPNVEEGKAKDTSVTLFNNGEKLENYNSNRERVIRSILFKFNSTIIENDAKTILDNVSDYLLENPGTMISIDGYACVIGKQSYNKDLSQKRADIVKDFFIKRGLSPKLITSIGKGEVNPTDDKQRDHIKYKNEKEYKENRRVDISFYITIYDTPTLIYETIAPSEEKKELTIDIMGFETKACLKEKEKHKKEIRIVDKKEQKEEKKDFSVSSPNVSLNYEVYSNLSKYNLFPIQYIWPKSTVPNEFLVYIHSCRWFSNNKKATALIKVYPDIRWTLEFKWNHKYPFAYSFGNDLRSYDIETGKKKVLGSEFDRIWSEESGEMSQFFSLSLIAEWEKKSQKVELGHKFSDRIAKTLRIFNEIKKVTDKIINSPVTTGTKIFEIAPPVIAVSAQWYLIRKKQNVVTVAEIGISTKPFVEVSLTIDIFAYYTKNIVCSGAKKVIDWITKKIGLKFKLDFYIKFSGSINIDGKIKCVQKDVTGNIGVNGKISVIVEFKSWVEGGSANIAIENTTKANAETSLSADIKAGIDDKGMFLSPKAEFGGIKVSFVSITSVKFGFFKKTYTYEDEAILVEKGEVKFEKKYINN